MKGNHLKIDLFTSWIIVLLAGTLFAGDDLQMMSRTMLIEEFPCENSIRNSIPSGWQASRRECSMFSVVKDESGCYLRLTVENQCTSIGKQVTFSIDTFPILSWKWRVHTLPIGGSEDKKETNDSGAGVYIIFKGKFKLNKIIKYVWSTTLPPGTVLASPFNQNTKIIVLQSGNEKIDQWLTETVNVREDYRTVFHTIPPNVIGIAILSDADNTGSRAVADYDDFAVKGLSN
jgi:hypothetical protein